MIMLLRNYKGSLWNLKRFNASISVRFAIFSSNFAATANKLAHPLPNNAGYMHTLAVLLFIIYYDILILIKCKYMN